MNKKSKIKDKQMNLGLQKHIIEKKIIKTYKERHMNSDTVIDSDWEYYGDKNKMCASNNFFSR